MPAVGGQHPGLRLDLLRGEHAGHGCRAGCRGASARDSGTAAPPRRSRRGVSPPPRHSRRRSPGTAGPPDRWPSGTPGAPVTSPSRAPAGARPATPADAPRRRPSAGQDPAQLVAGVVHDLGQQDLQHLTVAPAHLPHRGQRLGCRHLPGRQLDQGARWAHPVQRLVRAVVGVDGHRAVRLDQDQPRGHRQVRTEPTGVVHLTARNDQSHPVNLPGAGLTPPAKLEVWRADKQAHPTAASTLPGHATSADETRRTLRRPQRARRGGHQGLPLPRLLADDPGRHAPRRGLAGRAQPASSTSPVEDRRHWHTGCWRRRP